MKKREQKEHNFLLCIPSIKHREYEVENNKVYLIFNHNSPLQKVTRWFAKTPNKSDLELDDIGSFIWLNIDDTRTVYELGKKLKEEFGEKSEPLYERLTLYLRYLYKRGWISIRKPEESDIAKTS